MKNKIIFYILLFFNLTKLMALDLNFKNEFFMADINLNEKANKKGFYKGKMFLINNKNENLEIALSKMIIKNSKGQIFKVYCNSLASINSIKIKPYKKEYIKIYVIGLEKNIEKDQYFLEYEEKI